MRYVARRSYGRRIVGDLFDERKSAPRVRFVGQQVGQACCLLKDSTVANPAVDADEVPRTLYDAREVDDFRRALRAPVLVERTPQHCIFVPILLCQQESLREHAVLQCVAIALAVLIARIRVVSHFVLQSSDAEKSRAVSGSVLRAARTLLSW